MNPESFQGEKINNPDTGVDHKEGESFDSEILPKEVVSKIESFKKRESVTPMPDILGEKVEILLVRSGVKPSGEIAVYGDFEEEGVKKFNDKSAELLQEEVGKIERFLKDIGLRYKIGKPEIHEMRGEKVGNIRQEFLFINIARNQDSLDALYSAKGDEEAGLAYGYPTTAIESFLSKKAMSRSELPEEVKEKEFYPFIFFKLSKDNWQKEIKVAEQWANAVKKNSPRLFKEFMEDVRKHELNNK